VDLAAPYIYDSVISQKTARSLTVMLSGSEPIPTGHGRHRQSHHRTVAW
jgi:hypothetical protein